MGGHDQANINPPKKVKGNPEGFIHWDVDMNARPFPSGFRVCCRSKNKISKQVGFKRCLIFQNFEEWVKTQPEDRDPICPDMTGLSRENVDLSPGDLLIFNSLLAHGVRPNHSENRVRMAQYFYVPCQSITKKNARNACVCGMI